MSKRRSLQILLEELEVRAVPAFVCAANPVYEAECNYFNALIPQSAITVTAVKSGNWSDPSTWSTGRLPGNGDNVWIPNGTKVTVDGQEPGALRSILDNGVLTFATNLNTSLTVNTLVVGTTTNPSGVPQGELDIGTAANPIQPGVKAVLTFANLGPINSVFPNDPQQLSGGLISMGTVNIYGSAVTPYVNLAQNAMAGSQTLTLAQVPVGWKAGDTLLLPGTSPTANQDEQIQIAAISGNTVTLASPLAYSHTVPAGQSFQVIDETRNVVLQSQVPGPQTGGHVMFMHTDTETVAYADFLGLGRTDKSQPLNNSANGQPGLNQVGRYAVHFHRDYWPSINGNDPPVLVLGNFEEGSPGWGYDNHSSNVDMEYNVAYDNFGAGFVTEAGNEIGTFNGNLAVRTIGVPNGDLYDVANARQGINDFGFNGAGYWFQGPGCTVTNNIATDNQVGFDYYNLGLTSGALGQIQFWSQNTVKPGAYTAMFGSLAPVDSVVIPSFSGNTVSETTAGLQFFWHLDPSMPVPASLRTVINNFTVWDVTVGVNVQYGGHITIQNSNLTSVAGGQGTGILNNLGAYSTDVSVINTNVTGFALGERLPMRGQNLVSGGAWNNTTNFEIPPQASNLVSGTRIQIAPTVMAGQTNYLLDAAPVINVQQNGDPNNYFVPEQILLGGQELYYTNQVANYVPFPTAAPGIPGPLVGLTNQQLWNQFGLAMEGAIAPANATPFAGGLLGAPNPVATYYRLASPLNVQTPNYTLQYTLEVNGVGVNYVITDPTPVTLQPGWNVVTRTINGTTHSWLVNYNAPIVASKFAVSGLPAQILTGVPISITVTAEDASGNVAPGYTGTVALGSSDPSAVLPPAYTFTAGDHGVHTFVVTFNQAGTQSLTATDKTISGTLSGITVSQAPAGPVLLKDTFTGANGTLIQNHTMNQGLGWSVLSGSWALNNGQLNLTDTGANYDKVVADAGRPDVTTSATFTTGNAAGAPGVFGLVLRATDNCDCWMAVVVNNQLHLWVDTGGTHGYDLVDAVAPVTVPVQPNSTCTIKAVTSGSTITVYVNGVQYIQYTGATFNQTATKFGLVSYRDGSGAQPLVPVGSFEVDTNS
jgi:hypothetical protein